MCKDFTRNRLRGTMRILHLSADYPDPVARKKTLAIRNLLELAPQHDHSVYALNRVPWLQTLEAQPFSDQTGADHMSVRYPAPPAGVLHRHCLQRLARWIGDHAQSSGLRWDAVHAHKLTVEGLVGRILADRFDIPLIVSVQGNTDLKIAAAKPDLRRDFRQLWQGADVALPFAPWAKDQLDTLLGPRSKQTRCLPCPGPADRILTPTRTPMILRTAFNLDDHRNKNAARLIRAVGLVAKDLPQVQLEIIGGGALASRAALERIAARHAPGRVRFRGALPHGDMQAVLNTSAAFALVSHRESFGMVFAEALLAGTPCLIPRGRAIDGYLPDGEITLAAEPSSVTSIANDVMRLLVHQADFKACLGRYQQAGQLDFLRRDAIAQTYSQALQLACAPLAVTARNPIQHKSTRSLSPA